MSQSNVQGVVLNSMAEMVGVLITMAVGIDSNKDGKIDWNEKLAFGMALINNVLVRFNANTLSELKAELADLQAAEVRQAIEKFKVTFDLTDDELEELIEDTMVYVVEGFELAERYGKLRERLSSENEVRLRALPTILLPES